MEKEFIPYNEALELKELGFDEPCFSSYDKNGNLVRAMWQEIECSAPTFSQAFRWFREKHDLPNHIHTYWQHDWNDYSYQWSITENHIAWNSMEHYKSYEEAELACLKKLIEIVKNK